MDREWKPVSEHDIQHIGSETGVCWDVRWGIWAEYFISVVLSVLQQLMSRGRNDSRTPGYMLVVEQLQSSIDDVPPHEYRITSVCDTPGGDLVATIYEEIRQPEFLSRSEFVLTQEDNMYVTRREFLGHASS
ncbi:hypothetical protein EVAR_32905_1 [Eumeta japonica]|uniref:Uncharacterized protein n=1 Tax=Eumeta variegata TaxID=151549 RepID=A0A4C1VQX5_EUMVA|nr:hypothetical protein EVAR_32905_1 [Eumeta japonica]